MPSEASPRVAALFELLRCSGGAACRAAALLPQREVVAGWNERKKRASNGLG